MSNVAFAVAVAHDFAWLHCHCVFLFQSFFQSSFLYYFVALLLCLLSSCELELPFSSSGFKIFIGFYLSDCQSVIASKVQQSTISGLCLVALATWQLCWWFAGFSLNLAAIYLRPCMICLVAIYPVSTLLKPLARLGINIIAKGNAADKDMPFPLSISWKIASLSLVWCFYGGIFEWELCVCINVCTAKEPMSSLIRFQPSARSALAASVRRKLKSWKRMECTLLAKLQEFVKCKQTHTLIHTHTHIHTHTCNT